MTDSRGAEAVRRQYVSGQKAQTRLSGLALVLLAVLAYVTLHGGFRLLASASLGEDDPLESLLVQDLLLGYRAPQPPLYDWVLWCVQRVTGPGILRLSSNQVWGAAGDGRLSLFDCRARTERSRLGHARGRVGWR